MSLMGRKTEERAGKRGDKERRSIADLVLGRRLANREYNERKIGAFEGVPAMGLDGLGSSAYGPEAALTIPLSAPGHAIEGQAGAGRRSGPDRDRRALASVSHT
jgi:hypothetical protein